MKYIIYMLIIAGLIFNSACSEQPDQQQKASESAENDPPEIAIGERLFLETRFAQAYYANPTGVHKTYDYTLTMKDPLVSPFAGKPVSCRSCHMVDEHAEQPEAGMRTYADFIHNSPIPARDDNKTMTPRNSMALLNLSKMSQETILLHFDGEFSSMEELVRATLTRRNFGWKADEAELAVKHIADVIRTDDGKGELAREFGGSYTTVFAGSDPSLAPEFVLPKEYRLDVSKASDQQILAAVAKLIAAYVDNLSFEQDEQGNYIASPYDQFLKLNNLPAQPAQDETKAQYAQRLLQLVNQLDKPEYVTSGKQKFKSHNQAYAFGEKELQGMKLFFTRSNNKQAGGNCISCHAAPDFTDFDFHNTGMAQQGYDEIHGLGSFAKLDMPDLNKRNADYDRYLPMTAKHPAAKEPFRSLVNIDKPGHVDLGAWNVFANPDIPSPQQKLRSRFCKKLATGNCSDEQVLPLTIATFKTPTLRDLGHSNPYMHNGKFNTLDEVVNFYIIASSLARENLIVNAAPELVQINLSSNDTQPLVAFLKSLNEDYE